MNDFLHDFAAALTQWLWQATIAFSLIAIMLLLGHRRLLTWLGARSVYPLWMCLVIALGLPLLALVSAPALTAWLQPAQLSVWQSWTTMPGASAAPASITAPGPWLIAIAVLWLTPALAMIALFMSQYWQLRRQPCAFYKGLKVQWQPAGSSPGISGLLSPRLQLPLDFATTFSRSERRLIVQHELTHWRRRDLQVNTGAWFVLACQWFNPLAWKAYQRFRADQELSCDASVLAMQRATHAQDLMSKQVCYAHALLAAMQSVSFNAHPRNLWSSAVCTHYGIAQGERAMAQERFNQLNQHHQIRRWPALLGASLLTLAGLAWLGPVAADSMTQNSTATAASNVEPIVRIEPRYPTEAAEQGIEGHVDLSFVINDEGRVTDIRVLDSQPDDIFSAAAVSALQRWRYAPQDNLPQQIRLQFTLQPD